MPNFLSKKPQGIYSGQQLKVDNLSGKLNMVQPIPGSNDHNTQVEQLPPFEVLLSWLSYVYKQTGEWPLPSENVIEDLFPSQSDLCAGYMSRLTNITQNTEGEPGMKTSVTKGESSAETEKHSRRLKVVADYMPARKAGFKASDPTCNTINFSYVNSPYFAEACRLIEKYGIGHIQDELIFGCKLTLGLIIAWCHFPLFKNRVNCQGRWMTLATHYCTRELKIRTSSFKQYVTELERAGIIVTGQAREGIITREDFEQLRYSCANLESYYGRAVSAFWSSRSIQSKTIIYRFNEKVELDETLPEFCPFPRINHQGGNRASFDSHRERHEIPGTILGIEEGKTIAEADTAGKDLESALSNRERPGITSKSFLGVPCNELLIHDDVDDNKNLSVKNSNT